jgi:predicted GNAT family acetyltransferase
VRGRGDTAGERALLGGGRLERVGTLHVETLTDAGAAIDRARELLMANPVDLNVIWSVMAQRACSGTPGTYWLLESDETPVGIAIESPPQHPVAISPMPPEHALATATAIADQGHRVSGVAGEASTAAAFAGEWTELFRTAAEVEDAQRLYLLGEHVLSTPVPGRLRHVDASERELSTGWWSDFHDETGSQGGEVSLAVDLAISARRLFVWDDGGPRCLARATQPLGGISRIGVVYTPPEWRRRGYASACVGELCRRVRAEEGANSVLYAQLSNAGSNAMYRRLGFQAVSEVLVYRFGDAAQKS